MKMRKTMSAPRRALGQVFPLHGIAALLAIAVVSSASTAAASIAPPDNTAVTIDTTTAWNGTTSINSWGTPDTATYGQTITPSARQIILNSFTFNLEKTSGTAPQYQAFVYQWDSVNNRITGSALYTSAILTAPTSGTFVPVTFNTGGTALTAHQQYVLFLTTSTVSGQASSAYGWGSVPDATYANGRFVFMNNSSTFALLSTSAWTTSWGGDLAFISTFAPSGGPLSVPSTTHLGNTVALGAATVIDNNANLSDLSVGLTTEAQVSNAASQTLPLLTGSTTLATQNTLNSINNVIQSRIESNRGMSSGDTFYGDRHVWMKPFGSWADQKDRNGVAGFNANTYGLIAGIDGPIANAFQLGGALAYAKIDIDGNSSVAPQNADIDVYQFIGYGTYNLNDRTNINFQGNYGHNNIEGRRQITFMATTASSDYNSTNAHVGIGIDRTYALNTKATLIPSLTADYTNIKEYAYTETGAGLLNLSVDGRTADALIFGVNTKLIYACNDQTSLIGDVGVGYDTINDRSSVTSAFAGAPTASFVTYGIDPSPWLAHGGIGAVYKVKNGLDITGRYDTEYRSDLFNQTASLQLRWAF